MHSRKQSMIQMRLAAGSIMLLLVVSDRARSQQAAHAHNPTEKLGTVHLQTSCNPAVASQFDRAVALLHSFEFGESIRGFNAVLAADSTCAMAQWGIALSRWSNPMAAGSRSPAQLQSGSSAAAEAKRLGTKATERERGDIDARS